MEEQKHKRAIRAWAMYDWANSAFVTTVMAAVLPVYYANVAAANLEPNMRTAAWAYTTTISLLLVAIIGPILGAMADLSGAKKKFLTAFVIISNGVIIGSVVEFVRQLLDAPASGLYGQVSPPAGHDIGDFTIDGVKGMGNLILITHGNTDDSCPVTPVMSAALTGR